MTLKRKLLAAFFAALMLCSLTASVIAAEDQNVDLLFVTNNEAEKEKVLTQSNIAEYKRNIAIKVVNVSNWESEKMPQAKAVAVPQSSVEAGELESIYRSGVRTYVYGDLTINDYITYTGVADFGTRIPIYDTSKNPTGEFARRLFSNSQQNEKVYQIICEPQNGAYGLLCTIDKENDGNKIESYLNIIAQNYMDAENTQRATIVASAYDNAHYYYNDKCSVHLTWILYRNYNEEDANYDYFAIESRIWGSGYQTVKINQTTCEHAMYYPSDYIIDSGPASDSSASSISFSLDIGDKGVTGGSIGYNYTLQSSPKITRGTSNYPKSINWTASKRVFGSYLDNDVFQFASSWASTGTIAKMTIKYSNLASGTVLGESVTISSGVQTETVIFDY